MRSPLATLAGLARTVATAVPAAAAQVRFSSEAIEEIRSLIRAEVDGGGPDNGLLARLLEDVVRQTLERADILSEHPERGDDCCILRADVRLATGSGRSRFGVGYIVRLEPGSLDRFGNLPVWAVLWTGRSRSNIVERAELTESVRAVTQELAGEFVDRYRERFPRR